MSQDLRKESDPKYPGMVNLALAIARLQEVPDRYAGDKFMEIMRAQDALMSKSAKDAKAKGTLIGRTISSGVADGAAIYEICWVKGTHAYLRHIDYCDGYHARDLEQMAKGFKDPLDPNGVVFQVSKKFAQSRVDQADRFGAIFAKKD